MNRFQRHYGTAKPIKSPSNPPRAKRHGTRVPIRSVDRSSSVGPEQIGYSLKKEYHDMVKEKENNEKQQEPPIVPNMDSSLFSTILFRDSSSLCYCVDSDDDDEDEVDSGGKEVMVENKSLDVKPSHKEFGQCCEMNQSPLQPSGLSLSPEQLDRLRQLKSILCSQKSTVEQATQWGDRAVAHWVTAASDQPLRFEAKDVGDESESLQSSEKSTPQSENADICISQKPQVKVIAEKFTKYKKNAIEVRKLNEKVVCLEYDVFDSENIKTPLKKMRAYFSIKPKFKNADEGWESPKRSHTSTSSTYENSKYPQKQIEIIDSRISDNQSYLDDLRKVLQRKKHTNIRKQKSSLDLESLYDFAMKSKPILDNILSDAYLSKKQLDEVKALILQAKTSSVQGMSRRKVKCNQLASNISNSVISKTIIAELYR